MTRDEAKKLVMIAKTTYPNWNPDDLSMTIDVWRKALEEYDYQTAETAMWMYIKADTKGFAPSPGQIIDKIHLPESFGELTETEAWALVSAALRNGYYGAEQEFAKLPEAVQDAVGSPSNLRNWAMTDLESVENVIQSNFMRSYRVVLSRRRDYNKLSESAKELIGTTVRKMPEIEEKEHERPEGVPMPDRLKEKILAWRGEDDERI